MIAELRKRPRSAAGGFIYCSRVNNVSCFIETLNFFKRSTELLVLRSTLHLGARLLLCRRKTRLGVLTSRLLPLKFSANRIDEIFPVNSYVLPSATKGRWLSTDRGKTYVTAYARRLVGGQYIKIIFILYLGVLLFDKGYEPKKSTGNEMDSVSDRTLVQRVQFIPSSTA